MYLQLLLTPIYNTLDVLCFFVSWVIYNLLFIKVLIHIRRYLDGYVDDYEGIKKFFAAFWIHSLFRLKMLRKIQESKRKKLGHDASLVTLPECNLSCQMSKLFFH
ncbi:ATP-dependent Clp protease ATP-binding subunit ClpX, partial [Striga asiatica]